MLIKGKFSSNLAISYIIVRNMNKLALCFAEACLLLKKRRDGIKPFLARFQLRTLLNYYICPKPKPHPPHGAALLFCQQAAERMSPTVMPEEIVERGAALPAPYSAMSPSR
jgi:hypothetical protein